MNVPVQLVWLKRDLRLRDHRALAEAGRRGPVIVLYVFEPSLWQCGQLDRTHYQFIVESLRELGRDLAALGGRLMIRCGEFPEVLAELFDRQPFEAIFSHQETGDGMTYARDRRVLAWLRRQGVVWYQFPQHGVMRGLRDRAGWSSSWQRMMRQPIVETVAALDTPQGLAWGEIPTAESLGIPTTLSGTLQLGGESQAQRCLASFLDDRGRDYRPSLSSPLAAAEHGSRLSPYLAWGNLSIRQVHQAVCQRQRELKEIKAQTRTDVQPWLDSLRSFSSRLMWHCHFIQKLESEPELEFRNICRVYDGLREDDFDQERFECWRLGETGYPMIDACMRYLQQHRWINFRMRAMLMSFAAYQLWLHWRLPALWLARNFLDFEAGIHFPQCQMQSGVTGINSIRIYSARKQLQDQDPTGSFVKAYLPQLARVPLNHLAEPWRMSLDEQTRYGCLIGRDYPPPIVEERAAVELAKSRIYAVRRTPAASLAAQEVYLRHGSRQARFRDPLPGSTPSSSVPSSALSAKAGVGHHAARQPFLPGFDDE
jgi:deoxyribodipyrimidine photo-lyase